MGVDDTVTDGRRLVRAQNRERLLTAATELFAQRGYRATTTRDIAQAAGITERTLFRHVPSKAELFREAVVLPVEAFVARFRAEWDERPRGSRETQVEVHEFLDNLLLIVDGQRNLLLALLTSLTYEAADDELPPLRNTLAPLLGVLDDIFAVEAEQRSWHVDPAVTVRAIVGATLALTIHGDWLFLGGGQPTRQHLSDELTKLITWGLSGAPTDSGRV